MHYHNVPGSILIGIIATAVGFWSIKGSWPHDFVDLPHMSLYSLDFSSVGGGLSKLCPSTGAWGQEGGGGHTTV